MQPHPTSRLRKNCCYENEIVKMSETLEDLIDEYIDPAHKDFYKIKRENGVNYVLSERKRFIGYNDIRFDYIGTIYGAIYTSKGLIYVAKMNENGELKLI